MQFLVILLTFCFLSLDLAARPEFVFAIPNGIKYQCGTCHLNTGGGGMRNIFGIDFRNNGMKWDSLLAKLDTDNDGITNGTELQDPEGKWEAENANPGNSLLVTNPADPSDFPTNIAFKENINFRYFYERNSINFIIQLFSTEKFEVMIYNQIGELVKSFTEFSHNSVELILNWNLRDYSDTPVPMGLYFIRINQNGKNIQEKFLIER